MGDEKKNCCSKVSVILLIINTLLLLIIACKLVCPSGSGFCPIKTKKFCPISEKGSQKGSPAAQLQQK